MFSSEESSLNTIELQEWMNDNGSESNVNFTIVSKYNGNITSKILQESLYSLAQLHPMLRKTIKIVGNTPKFYELHYILIPVKEYPYTGIEQWKEATKLDIRQRFDNDSQPLWRVSFLKGNQEGLILLTFHHSIADGICGVELMNHLYKIISSKILNNNIDIKINYLLPPIENLYSAIKEDNENLNKKLQKTKDTKTTKEHKLCTNFSLHIIDEETLKSVIERSRNHKIKVHSILFAAFLKAIKFIKKPSFDQFIAVSIVNLRNFFEQPVSKEVTKALFSWIASKFEVYEETNIYELAKLVHEDLHTKLKEGKHISNLKKMSNRLDKMPIPQFFLQQNKSPPNLLCVSNIGVVSFDGFYDSKMISMEDIFFVVNRDSHFEHKDNAMLGVTTFKNRIYLTLFFIEKLFSETDAQAVLKKMEQILKSM
ncbi:MAG: condensation domain-containing protein [Chlamydiota bacterium]|nr:condensation domain-containing protein [Chlamydiota bacterium]